MLPKLFSFTHFRKKGLKTLSFHTLSKKWWGVPLYPQPSEGHMPCGRDSSLQVPTCRNRSPSVGRESRATSHQSPVTSPKSFNINTYENCVCNSFNITLTRKPHLKPFRINTYKKGGE